MNVLARLNAAAAKNAGARLSAGDVLAVLDTIAPDPGPVGPDPCDPYRPEDVDLHDPVERVAIVLALLSWHTPEDAAGVLDKDEDMARRSWAGPENGEAIAHNRANRSLYRRRAAAVLRVYGGRS